MKLLNLSAFIPFFILLFAPVVSVASNPPDGKNYTIRPEDTLKIRVPGHKDLQRTVKVSGEGFIFFPLIGKVKVDGQTVYEFESRIAEKLAEGEFLHNAQVSIETIKYGSQKVNILGEVKKPGRYFIKGKSHIFALLAEAGGVTDDADRTVTIVRKASKSSPGQLTYSYYRAANNEIMAISSLIVDSGTISNLKQIFSSRPAVSDTVITIELDDAVTGKDQDRFFVFPGDSLWVPEALHFYVTGEANKPGEFKWEKGLSVRRAIAMAGDPTKRGTPNRISILRFANGKETEFQPEMTDLVEPKDIINIPESYF